MIKVTADIFSGRLNPEWVVSGPDADAALRSLSLKSAASGRSRLGVPGAWQPWPYCGTARRPRQHRTRTSVDVPAGRRRQHGGKPGG